MGATGGTPTGAPGPTGSATGVRSGAVANSLATGWAGATGIAGPPGDVGKGGGAIRPAPSCATSNGPPARKASVARFGTREAGRLMIPDNGSKNRMI